MSKGYPRPSGPGAAEDEWPDELLQGASADAEDDDEDFDDELDEEAQRPEPLPEDPELAARLAAEDEDDEPWYEDNEDESWQERLSDEEYHARFVDLDVEGGDDAAPEIRDLEEEPSAPLIAIVGRPNVGKSRLFNRLTRSRFAIVEDLPGVTRDRQYGEGQWDGRAFQVVDTGGYEPESTDELLQQMREQASIAMNEADIILLVMDAQQGIMPADRDIVAHLRHNRKPIFLVANKVDGESRIPQSAEFWELGIADVYPLSAEHGLGFADLMDDVAKLLPEASPSLRDEELIRVAVVGRPNAGKSTLINRLLGEDRLLTSDIPGTTRDAINTRLVADGQRYLFIDTAGIRRKKKIHDLVEKFSVVQAFKALDRADVAVLVLDATQPVSSQDQRICGLAHDKGCALVLVLNKWDLVEKDHRTADLYVKQLREDLKFAAHAPVVTLSAKTGQRVHRLLPLIREVFGERVRRISTADVNLFLSAAVKRRSPPQRGGRSLRLYYGSQVATRPPTFMFVLNNPDMMHFSYERYLLNGLRQTFGFEGTPIKIFFRSRSQKAPDER